MGKSDASVELGTRLNGALREEMGGAGVRGCQAQGNPHPLDLAASHKASIWKLLQTPELVQRHIAVEDEACEVPRRYK